MKTSLLLLSSLLVWAGISLAADGGRTYHNVTPGQFGKVIHTHVCTMGLITLIKKEADGDMHIRVEDGGAFIVAEAIPHLTPNWKASPKKGETWTLCGIRRYDDKHKWWEVHPIEYGHRSQ